MPKHKRFKKKATVTKSADDWVICPSPKQPKPSPHRVHNGATVVATAIPGDYVFSGKPVIGTLTVAGSTWGHKDVHIVGKKTVDPNTIRVIRKAEPNPSDVHTAQPLKVKTVKGKKVAAVRGLVVQKDLTKWDQELVGPDGSWAATARAAAAHVFVEDLAAAELSGDDAHHLRRVLRLRAGETVSVSDGCGGWLPAAYRGDGALEALGPVVRPDRPAPAITVAMAVPKGDRPEWAVQKLTELGVDGIVALVTERGVVRWDAHRAERSLARWRAVARQAAMQSRRLWLPEVGGPVTPAALAASHAATAAMAEPGGPAPDLDRPVVLIGPEGGWSPAELGCGLPTVGLTPTVLRTETAAIAAASLLAGRRAGFFRP